MNFCGVRNRSRIVALIFCVAVFGLSERLVRAQFGRIEPHGEISPQTGLMELDDKSKQEVVAAILEQLDRYALHVNNLFYTSFEISPGSASPSQPRGFAPPVMPQGAPIVRHGLMEITPFPDWSVSIFPDRTGAGWSGVVSLRLGQYRVFEAERGAPSQ